MRSETLLFVPFVAGVAPFPDQTPFFFVIGRTACYTVVAPGLVFSFARLG
jgi:hypothetical protein